MILTCLRKCQEINDPNLFKGQEINDPNLFKGQEINDPNLFKGQEINDLNLFKGQEMLFATNENIVERDSGIIFGFCPIFVSTNKLKRNMNSSHSQFSELSDY